MQIILKGKRYENKKALLKTLKSQSPYMVKFPADDKYKKLFKKITIVDLESPQTTF